MRIEMRWLHVAGSDFDKDTVVLIKHASDPDVYWPLKLQHREVYTENVTGEIEEFHTEWQDVPIVKEPT